MEIDLKGKIAVVSGASGELGRVMASTLASCGADIALLYLRNAEKANELAAKIKTGGRRVLPVQVDLKDEASVLAMKDSVVKGLGEPDIVVNAAVSQYKWVAILEQNIDDFQDQFETCVRQNVLMAKAFLPAMIAKGRGRFIGINSERSYLCTANSGAYASAKRGMDGLYRVLANEVGPSGVTVNQVAPGWTISDKDRANHTEIAPEYSAKIPLARRGTDQEIANAVAFLASDLASFITGVTIPVCGGAVMV
ncbi:SDR family NAD(P)-dependent oxidoreductase [Leadbettera azotonutricia]|uniref:3-oxoacyl-[acyl-carrier-protein] reductase n=1 Tax=Leadbettera azotonutricia (strain ATCC BAA-888 / DSM 13862 / ZAS-9) TaxID=545695 RepID=F5YA18_LEAAZ|nr:SDR family oxidoreductase [Leadbettera azotonutricia]AEF83263.1 3-oxoacyl-[acyl-carrier-protein] reductase [Leadbettera azotonutricia ZAS-9]